MVLMNMIIERRILNTLTAQDSKLDDPVFCDKILQSVEENRILMLFKQTS